MRLALISMVLVACGEPPPEAVEVPDPPVHVETLSTSSVTPTAEGVTTIEASHSATLRAEAPGRVLAMPVAAGERVEAGAVIARLDVGRAAVALQAANAQVAQADAALAQAVRQEALASRLVASGSAAQQRLDDARDGVRMARAAVAAAQAQTRVTRRGMTEAVLRAPFSGTLAETFVEEGELASPGAPVALLVDTSSLEARVLLDPRQALDVPVGARATLTASARPDETFEARVLRVGEVVDVRTRRLPVELEIRDPEGRLRPGLVARVSVETGPARDALLVPSQALFERYGQMHVFIVGEDAVAQRRPVEVGSSQGDRLEVQAGLATGDRIVIGGLDRVVHERPVRIVEPVAEVP